METKANTALIGAFTLIALALGFVFVYWLARGSERTSNEPLTVIFENPVTGLAVGGQVVFNGIPIGTVASLDLDRARPNAVVAVLSVRPLALIKPDTEVTLGFQGLTGVGYVEMAGGSPDLPPIWEKSPPPPLLASRSSMQDLMASARGIMARADQTLKTVESLVVENEDDIAGAIRDVRAFTGALAENSDKVATLVEDVSAAATGIADATRRLQGIVERSEALMAAVDPETVRSTIADVSASARNIAAQSEQLGAVLARAGEVADDAREFSQHLPALGEKAEALVGAIDAEKIASAVNRIDEIATAIDPESVRTTVEGLSGLAETLDLHKENIDTIVTKLTLLSTDLSVFGARLPMLGEKAETLLGAIDAAKVAETIDNVDRFAAALAENTDEIDAIVADARAVSARFTTLADRAESVLTKIDNMAGSGPGGLMADAEATLAAVREAAETFNAQIVTVGSGFGQFSDRGLRDFQNLIAEGQRTISRLDRVISSLEQNPSGFIFGGESVPEYDGRRR
jgi:phospholipid/cholesterol/gamma-HCH transport system substrate-binding protein